MKHTVPVLLATIFAAAVVWFAGARPIYGQVDPANLLATINSVNQVFEDFGEKDGKVIDDVLDVLESQGSKQGVEEALPARDPLSQTKELIKSGQVKLPDRVVLAQARHSRLLVKEYARQGKKLLEKARQAKNPMVARVYIKDALHRADMVRTITTRLGSALIPSKERPETVSGPAPRASLDIGEGGQVFKHLKRIAKKGMNKNKRSYGRIRAAWEGVERPNNSVRGEGTRFFTGTFDPANESISLPNGQVVDVRPLRKALKKVAPKAARKPMFRTVSSPIDGREMVEATPELLKVYHSQQKQKQLKKVGGVDLDVTIDLLSFAGMPAFRSSGPAAVIESPVILSLRRLYRKVQPYSNSAGQWERLPDNLRYPGSLERIHGFVMDPQNNDVFLVGSTARSREARIDIDTLIVAIRSVWGRGDIPSVSLDSAPNDPGGPQYSRVYGVPSNSVMARIMLDADYAMKLILSGEIMLGTPGYKNAAEIRLQEMRTLIEQGRDDDKPLPASRYWFHPRPLLGGNIHVSNTGRTALFETRVEVLTEEERQLKGSGLPGYTGKADPIEQRAAEMFTEFYDRIERSAAIKPRDIFVKLHGVLDIVTVAKLWQYFGVDASVIREFSFLPVRTLRGSEAVPAFYPGVTTEHKIKVFLPSKIVPYTLIGSGGVRFYARSSRSSVDRYQDLAADTLEHTVDSFSGRDGFSKEVSLTFALPRAGGRQGSRVGQLLEMGRADFLAARFESSRQQYRELVGLEPSLEEAWRNLALVESFLGNHKASLEAVNNALLLEPDNPDLRQLAMMNLLRSDPAVDTLDWDESLRRDLSKAFGINALLAWSRDDKQRMEEEAEMALLLWDENPDAYFVRSQTHAIGSRGWSRDIDRSIRMYKRLMKQSDYGRDRLALALAWRAKNQFIDIGIRLHEISETEEGAIDTSAALKYLLEIINNAARDASESTRINPNLPLGQSLEIELNTKRVAIYQALGWAWEMEPILSKAREVVENFPDFAPAHRSLGYALGTNNDVRGATRALSRAIELNPTLDGALGERAGLYAMQGECEAARRDLQRAKEMHLTIAREVHGIVANICR
ncbi:MAG: hypothetical protein ACYS8I_03285 [Planctomycetota bacterium]|jgi:tetratricopeptide (TPR) repeat protein